MQNNTPKWLDLYITAFGAPGLVALAWWTGAFHAQRIRELQGSYPILHITGAAGAGKSTLVDNLWKLAGSKESASLNPSAWSTGALLALMARNVDRPMVLEECNPVDNLDWGELKNVYEGLPLYRRSVSMPLNGVVFRGALAYIGYDFAGVNSRVVNIHLKLQSPSEQRQNALQELRALQLTGVNPFLRAVLDNREQLIYRLCRAQAFTHELLTEIPMERKAAQNHAQLRALLELLGDLFVIPSCALGEAHFLVSDMAAAHARPETDDLVNI